MEPNDLNPPPPDDAQLEAWLRASAALPPLPDDGFTASVVATLPAPVAWRSTRRGWFCLGGALVGIVVAALGALNSESWPASFPAWEATIVAAFAQLSAPALGLALGITFVSMWFAFRDRLRLWPGL